MKNWKKTFFKIAVAVFIFSFVYLFLLFEAKNILVKKIEQLSGCKTSISKLIITLPFNLSVKKIEITGLIKADEIYLSPSLVNFLFGRFAFNEIRVVKPELTYQRIPPAIVADTTSSANIVIDAKQAPVVNSPVTVTNVKRNKTWPVIIKKLRISSGKLNFIDSTAASGSISVVIKGIELSIDNLSSQPSNLVSKFFLKGNLSWNTGEPDGKISLEGWLNTDKKDVQATLKIEDIDAIVFYPYYSTWVDLNKARIEKAKLRFTSNISGKNNDVTAECHLELVDMVRKVRLPEEPQQKAERVTDAVLDILKTMDNGKVVLDFVLHTKMDRPEFGFANIKSAFEGKLKQARASSGLRPQDMLLWPGKWVQSGIKSGTSLTTAMVDGVFALSNGIKKFFEDIINKPVPEN